MFTFQLQPTVFQTPAPTKQGETQSPTKQPVSSQPTPNPTPNPTNQPVRIHVLLSVLCPFLIPLTSLNTFFLLCVSQQNRLFRLHRSLPPPYLLLHPRSIPTVKEICWKMATLKILLWDFGVDGVLRFGLLMG
jgi:hypothetical protein